MADEPTVRPEPIRSGRPLAIFALASFALLAVLIGGTLLFNGRIDGSDVAILTWVRSVTGSGGVAVDLARGITALGNNVTLWCLTLLVAGHLAVARRRHDLLHLLAVTASGGLLTTAVKAIVDRARPIVVERLVDTNSASFPSGHAMNSAFVYGTLALLAMRVCRSPAERRYVVGSALLLIVLIGCSRVVLGVHWPSDVLAGWSIGAGWAVLGLRVRRLANGDG